jgi:hypothetical protein
MDNKAHKTLLFLKLIKNDLIEKTKQKYLFFMLFMQGLASANELKINIKSV